MTAEILVLPSVECFDAAVFSVNRLAILCNIHSAHASLARFDRHGQYLVYFSVLVLNTVLTVVCCIIDTAEAVHLLTLSYSLVLCVQSAVIRWTCWLFDSRFR